MFKQETSEVIMLLNYYIEKGNDTESTATNRAIPNREKRIRVNDKTATGGWF